MRYAIYFLPQADSALWKFGSGILGYDSIEARRLQPWPLPSLSAERARAMIEEPRRYGFHATLKAPFRLAQDKSVNELFAATKRLANDIAAFDAGPLTVKKIKQFIALVPCEPKSELAKLSACCVETLDAFRAAPTATEIARRRPELMSRRKRELFEQWGYPFVFEFFNFHMTLTVPHM